MNTEKILLKVINELKDDSIVNSPKSSVDKIPTLEEGVYRPMTPMLRERFAKIGSWLDSTHGDWLDIGEMESFWNKNNEDPRVKNIINNVISSINNWEDDAGSVFARNRVSIFSGSEDTYERIYLIWFDGVDEPEFWVYDVNGETRYKDFDTYLKAYLDDDLSAVGIKWKLGQM